jgi:hypothetical protein
MADIPTHMKTKYSLKTRLFAFFLASQFLNVQIQSAYGTEAVVAASPEARAVMAQLETKVMEKLADKSERQLNRIAYRLYKLNLKLRNKAVKNDNEAYQMDLEDQEAIAPFADGETAQVNEQALKQAKEKADREKIISQSDALLTALGSTLQDDGSLSKVSFEEFKENAAGLKANDLRSPAGIGRIIVKIILVLLVLALGYVVLLGIYVILFLLALAGAILSNLANILAILTLAAVIVGVVLLIKVIVQNERRINDPQFA